MYRGLENGAVDRSQLSDGANAKLTDDLIKAIAARIAPLGEPVTFEPVNSALKGSTTIYAYLLTFGSGAKLDYVIGFDAHGKVDSLGLSPAPER